MYDGYVKIYRKMIDTSFYKNPKMTLFAIHCLLRANHKPTNSVFNMQNLNLKRGEFISSLLNLRKETGLSIQEIRTCIQTLSNIGFLTSKPTNKFTIFHVEKYDFYQFANGKTTRKATNQQQTNNKPVTTDKNDKTYKNDKKKEYTHFADFVLLTEDEYSKLISNYDSNIINDYIDKLNSYIGSKGKNYKSHYYTILSWLRKDNISKKPVKHIMTDEEYKKSMEGFNA